MPLIKKCSKKTVDDTVVFEEIVLTDNIINLPGIKRHLDEDTEDIEYKRRRIF